MQQQPQYIYASLAQWVVRQSHNLKAVSSILTGGIFGNTVFILVKFCNLQHKILLHKLKVSVQLAHSYQVYFKNWALYHIRSLFGGDFNLMVW